MATASATASTVVLLQPKPISSSSSSTTTLVFLRNTNLIPSSAYLGLRLSKKQRPLTVSLALAESDSAKSLEPDPQSLLQQLADNFDLPQDYFTQLPRDLRLDLNDAAFDLSNGPVVDECGLELGETLLNLSRAWEKADTSTSHTLVSKLPKLEKRFQAMGQYGQGELQKIAEVMITTGRRLSASSVSSVTDEQPKTESRMFKFGELQVEVTSDKANIGAAISLVFGILSWQIAQGIQSIPESSLQYANDNALLLAKSLRGALLAAFYASTVLSVSTSVGLVLLGRQLKSKGK
ncbi:LOW protein: ammonium transporter 1-like protein [Trema orientale]|uniref:LOW protein: ammonium transporter 1-like protein n=1 Tax=Trema orientale TaxID=63057 RepID=A0A2P5FYU3_TREOI|nr:LOW protein: ammonium transporter 1-like protein [Trema orientale]